MPQLTIDLTAVELRALTSLAHGLGTSPEELAREAVLAWLGDRNARMGEVGKSVAARHADVLCRLGEGPGGEPRTPHDGVRDATPDAVRPQADPAAPGGL
ncbi:hypothetical protein [Streptomyces sp. CBMA29]|uniref:hypothetical protein n=1 Tax=Streptomyces sp. CBMA29 TaxID=1896314 RepID=UPI0016619196|nr:hypothetical protein [Streptomyces sp. CBMA29]MBD0738605.1 hypothetical protein [Streptomyces sp. CBMA29]